MKSFDPKWVSRPSATIKDCLESKNISLSDFCSLMQMDTNKFLKFMNDEIEIEEYVAIQLKNILGGSKKFWLNRYNNFFEGVKLGKKII